MSSFWLEAVYVPSLPPSLVQMLAPRSKAKWIDFFFSLSSSPSIQIFFQFGVLCHGDKSWQGGFRQRAVTHVTAGAKSEHSGQRDANTLEMCAGGFIVAYFIWNMAGACSDVYFARVNWDVLRREHTYTAVYCQWDDFGDGFLPQKLVKMSYVVIQALLKKKKTPESY